MTSTLATEELDFAKLIQTLLRRWPWIVLGGVSGLLVASWITRSSKPVWAGELQIVLAQKGGGGGGGISLGGLASQSPLLAGLAGLQGGKPELETEIKILESPSVLRPVFEQVKLLKSSRGENVSGLKFGNWSKSNLSIKLEKGTSVLNISYQDTDQTLIIPVMEQISQAYQRYSSRDRSESLRNGLSYLQNQVNRFRAQSSASSRAVDAYSIRYGISSGGSSGSGAAIESFKILSSGAGRGEINSNFLGPTGSGSSGTSTSEGNSFQQLEEINKDLIRKRQTFTDRDPIIQSLLRERDALRRHIEITAGGKLALPGSKPASKEQAQDILLRFKELERQANRDSSTLNSLENNLLSLQLDQARASQPWELISAPTLQDAPIAPRPARNLALGLLAGLALGSVAALAVDRRSGLLFSLEELQQELPGPLLAELHSPADATLQLVANGPLANASTVGMIPLGLKPGDPLLQALHEQLQQLMPHASVLICVDGVSASNCSHCLLVTQLGAASRTELKRLRQQLQLHPQPLTGWLLIGTSSDG